MQDEEDVIKELRKQLLQKDDEHRQAQAAFQAEKEQWELSMQVSLLSNAA